MVLSVVVVEIVTAVVMGSVLWKEINLLKKEL
jgi:hypothetical protein